jgi:dTDP-glucose 4,6-dehydratase
VTGRAYAIGGGTDRPNLQLVEKLLDLVDESLGRNPGESRLLIRFVRDRPGHDFRYAIDFSRITTELGWSPAHDLDSGLGKTVSWYLSHREWLEAVLDDSYREYYDRQYALRN